MTTAAWLEPKAEEGDQVSQGCGWYEDAWPMESGSSEWKKEEMWEQPGSTKWEWDEAWPEESWGHGWQQDGGIKQQPPWKGQHYKPTKKDGWYKAAGDRSHSTTSSGSSSGKNKGTYVPGGFVNRDGQFFKCLAYCLAISWFSFPGLGYTLNSCLPKPTLCPLYVQAEEASL